METSMAWVAFWGFIARAVTIGGVVWLGLEAIDAARVIFAS